MDSNQLGALVQVQDLLDIKVESPATSAPSDINEINSNPENKLKFNENIASPVFHKDGKSKVDWFQNATSHTPKDVLSKKEHYFGQTLGKETPNAIGKKLFASNSEDSINILQENFAFLMSPSGKQSKINQTSKILKESSNSTLFDTGNVSSHVTEPLQNLIESENPFLLSRTASEASNVNSTIGKSPVNALRSPASSPSNFPVLPDEKPNNLFSGTGRKTFMTSSAVKAASPDEAVDPGESVRRDLEDTYAAKLAKDRKVRKLLERRLEAESRENKSLRAIVDNYEATFEKIIGAVAEEKQKAEEQISALLRDRSELEKKVDLVESLFKDMRSRYENTVSANAKIQKHEDSLQETIQELRQEVSLAQERLEKVVKHAEEQLQGANSEISKLRSESDKDQSMLKAKLARGELKLQSLEKALIAKEEEYKQMTKLCDDLVSQLEGRS